MRQDSGTILGWKYAHAEGIRTVGGVITDWPESLGAKPTSQQIDAWGAEYDAAMAAAKQAEETRKAKRFQDILDALPTLAQHRDEINSIIDATQASTNIAGLRSAVLDFMRLYRKDAKVLYWIAKESDT